MEMNQTISDTKMRLLQNTELELLKAFDDICKSNNIDYYLGCGTLLGCIRHHGFIPWDDDTDVLMKREDYKKFISLPEYKLPAAIRIRSFYNSSETDSNISLQTKVESVNKKVLRKAGDKIITQNIWLDVFVIDGMPASKVGRWLHYYRIRFCQNLFRTARSARNGVLKEKTQFR